MEFVNLQKLDLSEASASQGAHREILVSSVGGS
jgi:hypothetical protein